MPPNVQSLASTNMLRTRNFKHFKLRVGIQHDAPTQPSTISSTLVAPTIPPKLPARVKICAQKPKPPHDITSSLSHERLLQTQNSSSKSAPGEPKDESSQIMIPSISRYGDKNRGKQRPVKSHGIWPIKYRCLQHLNFSRN